MFFAERIKEWLRPRPPNEDAQQTKEEAEALSTKVEIGEDGVPGEKGPSVLENQYAPPGYFAPAAPKPSKAAVMIFYMSVAFCIIGCIMIIKGVFKPNLKHSDIVPGDLGMGAAVLALGIVLAIVMNELNRREYNKIMAYVTLKVEEMQQSANSRQRFNEDYAAGTVPVNSQGPYGNQ